MKNSTKNKLTLLFILTILFLVFSKNSIVKESVLEGVSLFLTKVFPSLFPMFILSNLLIYYQLPEILSNHFGGFFQKIFHTSVYGIFVFVLALLSGTPSNAYILKELIETKKITIEEANDLISFTFFANPLFLYSILNLIFNNQFLVIKIIFIHYIANIFIGLILRQKKYLKKIEKIPLKKETISFGFSLSKSIEKALQTLLMILGTITFFILINNLFNTFPNPFLKTLGSGFIEMTQGLNQLITCDLPMKLKEILALIFISFGGLSIHMQVHCIISETKISYQNFLKGRIFHVLIVTLIAIIT